MSRIQPWSAVLLVVVLVSVALPTPVEGQPIPDIRSTQTGGTDLGVDTDVTPFSTTGAFGSNIAAVTTSLPPGFSKSFGPNPIVAGAGSTLTLTIDNFTNSIAATGLTFTDTLPAGLVIRDPSFASTTCTGGTVTGVSGSDTISYTGGSVAGGDTCRVSVDVTAATPGDYVNTSGALTSSLGNSGTSTDTLTVVPEIGFTKAFTPDQISPGDVSTLTFTIDNSAGPVALTAIEFIDNLPDGMTVATPANGSDGCAGLLNAADGATSIVYQGGSVAAGDSCTIDVDVTIAMAGDFDNVIAGASSSVGLIGTGGAATATLSGGLVVDVPSSSGAGLALLAGLLGWFAILAIRRAS